MSRMCEICGKKTMYGNKVATRGLPKSVGGIGLKTTGIVRRHFKPNIQRIRAMVNGSVRRIKICTSCLKAGKVQKPLRRQAPEKTGS